MNIINLAYQRVAVDSDVASVNSFAIADAMVNEGVEQRCDLGPIADNHQRPSPRRQLRPVQASPRRLFQIERLGEPPRGLPLGCAERE
jgi:hypothetical protein